MRANEFKRRLRIMILEELKRTDLKGLVRKEIARTDWHALVSEAMLTGLTRSATDQSDSAVLH